MGLHWLGRHGGNIAAGHHAYPLYFIAKLILCSFSSNICSFFTEIWKDEEVSSLWLKKRVWILLELLITYSFPFKAKMIRYWWILFTIYPYIFCFILAVKGLQGSPIDFDFPILQIYWKKGILHGFLLEVWRAIPIIRLALFKHFTRLKKHRKMFQIHPSPNS